MTKYQWVLLLLFFVVWLAAGYWERERHERFFHEVDTFIHKGDRFTADDGRALTARIVELERRVKALENPANQE